MGLGWERGDALVLRAGVRAWRGTPSCESPSSPVRAGPGRGTGRWGSARRRVPSQCGAKGHSGRGPTDSACQADLSSSSDCAIYAMTLGQATHPPRLTNPCTAWKISVFLGKKRAVCEDSKDQEGVLAGARRPASGSTLGLGLRSGSGPRPRRLRALSRLRPGPSALPGTYSGLSPLLFSRTAAASHLLRTPARAARETVTRETSDVTRAFSTRLYGGRGGAKSSESDRGAEGALDWIQRGTISSALEILNLLEYIF